MGGYQKTIRRAERTFDAAAEFVRLLQFSIGSIDSCAIASSVAKNRRFAGPATYCIGKTLQCRSGNIAGL
jgi:hypothetical protein